ncbi:zinc ribbon domain-containing protein [Streptomyces carpinensis]|uniref:Cas12f1-like TNB domain-containing protein n=1 Tax=Streptomyces carpinensis TaxID=66369 RepID=A0ABV1WKG1_9ACTN|nr:hypothetical protein [Streptomyces carpinensis]
MPRFPDQETDQDARWTPGRLPAPRDLDRQVATPDETGEVTALAKARRKERGRKRALDRSRRASNPSQYGPSKRQQARAERRAAAGLPARAVQSPGGARVSNKAGIPKQAYRRDTLSSGYRLNRARLAEAAATAAAAKDHRARRIAADIVADHGANLTIEDCDIRTWYRRWGKALQATTPGRLIAAIGRECEKVGGRVLRASTFTTKLSQTCFCGATVTKTLADRIHVCTSCGLTGDRDAVSGALCAHVRLDDPDDPSTARLDKVQARHTQIVFEQGLQEALSSQPQRGARPARGRTHAAAPNPEHLDQGPLLDKMPSPGTGPTPNETRPANARHKIHAGAAGCTDSPPPRCARSVQTSGGHHSIT